MNIFKKIEEKRKILTNKDVDKKDNKEVKIYIKRISTTDEEVNSRFYVVDKKDKAEVSCNKKDRELCDKVCKDYCLCFNQEKNTRYIWSCYIEEWERL